MQWSNERILTTHTGSLPRPPELTRLYVRRARGEAVEEGEIVRRGKRRGRADRRQSSSPRGLDIGNNGEQQREAVLSLCPPPDDWVRQLLDSGGRAAMSSAIRS